jgi:hypothetical protein
VSALVAELRERAQSEWVDPERLERCNWLLLRAETSCNFYWGDAWIYKTHNDLDGVAYHLARAREMLGDLADQPAPVGNDPAAAAPPGQSTERGVGT